MLAITANVGREIEGGQREDLDDRRESSNLFLARLLAYGVVVGGGGGGGGGCGCGRDIFRFLYIARDKPGDKQNATTAPIRYAAESDSLQPQNREFGETVVAPVNANGNQSEERKTDRPTR